MAAARTPVASSRARAGIVRRLSAATSQMTTATVTEMERRHPWFAALDAENRSWITLVARAGIDGFVTWFADPTSGASGADVFGQAPRALARKISLHQTVELVRTTIDIVEEHVNDMPKADRAHLRPALAAYSRDVAFAATEVYARAAEIRGAWDVRIEALVVDAVLRGETDETVLSRASTLGWRAAQAVTVVVGAAPDAPAAEALEDLHQRARRAQLDLLAAVQGERLVAVVGSSDMAGPDAPLTKVAPLIDVFGPGPVVVGPVVDHLMDASRSARSTLSGLRAAPGWPEAPRPVGSDDLLPERALSGDGHARRALAHGVYGPLRSANGGLLETLVCFLDEGQSIEATARKLFIHANTVRYRLRRIHEVCGFSPTEPRDSYVLRLAITLGRLLGDQRDA